MMTKEKKVVLTMMIRKVKLQLTKTAQNLKKLNLKILNNKNLSFMNYSVNLYDFRVSIFHIEFLFNRFTEDMLKSTINNASTAVSRAVQVEN